ncbi:prp 8 CRoW domain-containing protein [Coccidioides immitis RS]|uniref:Prp 8 CRoW domain-containing protein n=1 Tax=Coccidioides immitis (strain RS) TaxID=246410 RepID=J3KKK9_COCIM|nr:prp 8 CRoW domain-containing protein [Coccidioides immitis RS]EAS36719.3 prp 8 CRoW domain-containing protein [Coccidioides immitis RS]
MARIALALILGFLLRSSSAQIFEEGYLPLTESNITVVDGEQGLGSPILDGSDLFENAISKRQDYAVECAVQLAIHVVPDFAVILPIQYASRIAFAALVLRHERVVREEQRAAATAVAEVVQNVSTGTLAVRPMLLHATGGGSQCSAQRGYCLKDGATKSGSKPSETKGGGTPSKSPTQKPTKSSSKPTLTKPTKTKPTLTKPTSKPTKSTKPTSRPSDEPTLTEPEKSSTSREHSTQTRPTKSDETPSKTTEEPTKSNPSRTSSESKQTGTRTFPSITTSDSSTGQGSSLSVTVTDDRTETPTSTASAIPTLIFNWARDLTDDLVENMCLEARTVSRHNVKVEIVAKTKSHGANKGFPLSCDEYPFSSTVEGGPHAHVGCIVAFQNGAQGDYLKAFYRDYKLKKGDKYYMKITGIDCDVVHEDDIPKCNRFGKRDILTDSKGIFYPPDAARNTGRLVIALGDVEAGSHRVMVSFPKNSQITNVFVINNQGYEYAASSKPISETTYQLSFHSDEAIYGASFIAETEDSHLVASSWKHERVPAPSTASRPPSTTTVTTTVDGTTLTTTYCPETTVTRIPTPSETVITTIIEGSTVTTTVCPETEINQTEAETAQPSSKQTSTPSAPGDPPKDLPHNPPEDLPEPPPEQSYTQPPLESNGPENPPETPPSPTAPRTPPVSPPGDEPEVPEGPATSASVEPPAGDQSTSPPIAIQTTNAGRILTLKRWLNGVVCVLVPFFVM